MMRVASLALLTIAVGMLAVRSAKAELPVAPQPRAVRPDGTRDPAPPPQPPAKAEDPTVVVDRIIKNSKDVGDKLAKTDTGTNTRKTQDKILADIDSLINRQENPPPKPDDNKDKDKNKDMNNDPMMNKNNDPMMNPGMPPPKGGEMPMDKSNMGMGEQNPMPMGGMGMNEPQPMGRRPRMGEQKNDSKHPDKSDAKNEPNSKDKQVGKQPKESKNAKNPSGAAGGGNTGKMAAKPSLPFDEDVAKDVWGHLPDKLRQQMTQYYKEDVMPKYAELLRLYYSSLSEKTANPTMFPKK